MKTHLKKNKIKGVEDFPRVRISEEFPRKSIVTDPPFGKDIVNLEKKYGTVSGYKMYPFGRAREEFKEDEHPRKDDGKFAPKGSTAVRQKFDKILREDTAIDFKLQEGNIKKKEIDLQKLKDMKEDYKANPSDYHAEIHGKPFNEFMDIKIGIWERYIKQEHDKLQVLKDSLSAYDKSPFVTLQTKPNTHKVGEKGFKFGAKKFKGLKLYESRRDDPMIVGGITKKDMGGVFIDSSLNKNASELALKNYELVKDAWNELSDEDRELVDVLKFRFSNTDKKNMGSHSNRIETDGKIFKPAYIEVQLSNSLSTGTSAINTLVHEVGHAKFAKIEKTSPEKVEKFNKTVREIGAVTPYVKTYERNFEEMKIEHIRERGGREYKGLNDIQRKNKEIRMERELKNADLIFGNEAHSEFYAMLHSPTLNYGHTITNENMEKMAKAYKELHDIE